MTVWDFVVWVVSAIGILMSAWWTYYFLRLLTYGSSRRWLHEASSEEPPGGWPKLAVVFAARNEGPHVEKAARSLLAQDYQDMELIAVNDRSTDDTGSVLDRLAAENSRLKVVHVGELPAGRLGKNHALHRSWQATDAEWLLFTDADVVFAPQALRKAMGEVIRRGLDHLVVLPVVPTESVGERLFISLFVLQFAIIAAPWRLDNPRSRAFLGIGAFNLVRTGVLKAISGFEPLRLSVDDDMQLGRAIKWSGFRSGFSSGWREVSVRWQVGLGGMIRGLEKNFFAAARYRVVFAAAILVITLILGWPIHLAIAAGPWWVRTVCAVGLVSLCGVTARVGWQNRIGWYYGLLVPLSSMFSIVALLRSTWLTLRRGGVSWRDHLYPLCELRQHVREREAWMRQRWAGTQARFRTNTASDSPPSE